MRARLAWSLAAFLACAGCDDRRAGTEVGNPEVALTATFASIDTTGQARMGEMSMLVMNMTYALARSGYGGADTDTCWSRPGGTLVRLDMPDPDGTLRDTTVRDGHWTRAEMVLRPIGGPGPLPDAGDFDTWADPHYARFRIYRGADSLSGLFEMPQAAEIRLIFSQATIDTWRQADGSIWVTVLFDAGKWLGPLNPGAPWTTRLDGKRARYVVFSPTENASAWAELKARLPQSFAADSVRVR